MQREKIFPAFLISGVAIMALGNLFVLFGV